MALTVGELNGVISIDDRAVDPALRRTENALRAAGQQMGDDADRAGQQAGQQLGDGIVQGADGRLRNAQGRFVAAGRRAGDGVGEGLGDGAADGADEAVDRAEGGLSKLKTAALGIGIAAGAVLMDAFGQAMEQGQITAKLGATLGKTPAEAQRYGKIAGQLYAGAITEDFQTAADTIGSVMGSGLVPADATNSQIQSISTKVADLANTFGQDLVGVTNAASQLMRTGLAKNSTEALDIIAKGFGTSANKADDFLDTLNEYSVQFKRVGLSGQTAIGLIDQAIKGGARDSDQVADALGQFGELAIGQSKGVQEAFKSIGLNSDQVAAKLKKGGKSGQEALQMTLDALRGTKDETTKLNAATALFGDPGTVMGDALFAMDPAGAAAASGMDKAAGSAKKLGDSVRDNAATQVEQFKRGAMQRLVEFLGTSVIPGLMKFFGFLQEHQAELKTLAIAITAVVVPALIALGVQALIAGGRMAAAWVAALGPIGWVGLAIGALVVLVITYWDQIKGATLTAWNWIVGKVSSAKDGVLAAVAWLGTIPGKVSAWFGQAKDWAIAKFVALVAWLNGLPGRASGAISGLGSAISAKASSAWQSFRDATAKKVTSFIAYVTGLPGRISRGVGSLSGLLTEKGRNVVQGLWNGIASKGAWIYSKIIGWAKSVIPGPIAKALGINSPSKVTKAQGRWIVQGLVDGLTGSSKQIKAASGKLSDIIADSLAPGKRRSKALGTLSVGTKKLLKLASQEEKLAARMKTASKSLADQVKARDALAATVKKGVLDGADITKQDTGGWPQTAASILAGLQADTAAAQLFAKNLATLRKKGVRADLISQIAQAGVEQGSSAAAALANANSGQIKQINSQQAALVKAAGQAGATAGDAMYGAGINAARGLIKGLQSQQKAIERQMLAIARGMSKAIRAALGIKSPSKVMALVGAYTAQGLRKGIESERAAVNRSMSSLVETPAPGSWDMATSRARAAAAQKVVVEFQGSDRGETAYLMGKMRRGIQRTTGGDVEFALAGKRSS